MERTNLSNETPQSSHRYSYMGMSDFPLLGCLTAQTGYSAQHWGLLYAANLTMSHLPFTVEDEKSWDASHAKEPRDLAPYPRGDIQPHKRSLGEFAFNPVDDGLGQEARWSSIAVEDHHSRRSSLQVGQKVLDGRDLGWACSQEHVCQDKPSDDEHARPIRVPEARQSAHWSPASPRIASSFRFSTGLGANPTMRSASSPST